MLTRAGVVEGDLAHGILPSGQVAGLIADAPTVAELMDRIEAEAVEAIARLSRRVEAVR